MKITDDELISIIEEVTDTLGQILMTYRELTEGHLETTRLELSKDKVEDLKRQIDGERVEQEKIRHTRERKKELERIRDQHRPKTTLTKEGSGSTTTPILNGQGKVVGYLQTVGKGGRQILNPKGQVVAREINGRTYDQRGVYRGRGLQGLRVLGQMNPRSN